MAFVNETISEADKQRIDFSKIKHPYHRETGIIPNNWTIDRERDIALIPLGGGGEPLTLPNGIEIRRNIFVMYWRGQLVNVFLLDSHTGHFPTNNFEVTWRMESFAIPENVSREEILKTLKEALFTFGYVSGEFRDKVKAVHFEF